jgi:NAD(P)H-hydrate epimerase
MERAGLAVFDSIRELLPDGGKLTVYCGKGHNGGDGFAVARLALEAGYDVDCLVAAVESDLVPDTLEQMRIAKAQGVVPIFADDARFFRKAECVACCDLIVDALLGTGAQHDVKPPICGAIASINRSGVPVIAVDIPSGIHCDTGEELGESVWALQTVTFGLPKPCLFQGLGLEHAGYWKVADIGYPQALLHQATDALVVDRGEVANLIPERLRASHKGENGSVLIVAGSRRMPGAASLCARSALRSGAGLVTVAGIQSVCDAVAANVPEALLLPLAEVDGVISPDAAETLLKQAHLYHSALFGPGLTHFEPILDLLSQLWSEWESPCVIDADALNAVSAGVPLPNGECVLTPHPGEMSRLLQSSAAEVQADRFRAVEHALTRYSRCALLKGPYSIVGEPGQPLAVNPTGNPGMASAGMGDVLSGVIATLLAQDLPPYFAAIAGMYWHGLAGDLCAEAIGPIGYTAMDVAQTLPRARARITASCNEEV